MPRNRSKGRSCIGKKPNPDRAAADAQRHRMARKWDRPITAWSVYQCRHCGCWHIGNTGNTDNPRNREKP